MDARGSAGARPAGPQDARRWRVPAGRLRTIVASCALAVLAAGEAAAQTDSGTTGDGAGPALRPAAARIDLPLIDLPYATRHGFRAPSMQQSLGVTAGVYDVGHLAIQKAWGRRRRLAKATITVVDYFATGLPFADAWLHEEWHRAVLGHHGIGSRNDVYSLDVLAATISVSHVSDAELSALKRDHPRDFVRLKAAGIESEYALLTRLQKERFFRDAKAWHTALYWWTTINSVLYLADTSDTDAFTDEANAKERTVRVRDISGHDFTAWARDLHRPDEPFEARGVHPSGVGVDRYVKTTDLTREEQRYLHRQGQLSLLNFVAPQLFGFHGLTVARVGAEPVKANLSLRHMLTSFGNTVDVNVFVKHGETNLFVVLHAYSNGARTFPGLEAELGDVRVALRGRAVELTPRLMVWSQPAGQEFRTRAGRIGGMAALRARTPLTARLGTLAELELKSAGWVAGVVQLEPAVNVRVGASASIW